MLSHVSAPHFGFWLLSPAWVAIVFVSASSHWWAVASCYVLYFHLLSFRPRNKSSTENGLECLPKALVTFHIAGTKQTNNTAAKTATSRRNGLFPPLAWIDLVHQFHSSRNQRHRASAVRRQSDRPCACSLSLFIQPGPQFIKYCTLHVCVCVWGLSTSIYPAQKLCHRHPRRFVSMVIINPIE